VKTEIISDVFKILIPNYSNRASILPNSKSFMPKQFYWTRLICRQLFLEQNQPKKALQVCTFVSNRRFVCQLLVYENSKSLVKFALEIEPKMSFYIRGSVPKENKIAYIKAFQLAERTKSGVLRNFLSNKKTASREEKLQLEQLQN
jgi:hypothetical protein